MHKSLKAASEIWNTFVQGQGEIFNRNPKFRTGVGIVLGIAVLAGTVTGNRVLLGAVGGSAITLLSIGYEKAREVQRAKLSAPTLS